MLGLIAGKKVALSSMVTHDTVSTGFTVRNMLRHETQDNLKTPHISGWKPTPATAILICACSIGRAADGAHGLLAVTLGLAASALITGTVYALPFEWPRAGH